MFAISSPDEFLVMKNPAHYKMAKQTTFVHELTALTTTHNSCFSSSLLNTLKQ